METTNPLCPYFGTCGGCSYQNLAYEDELALKEGNLRQLLHEKLGLSAEIFLPIVPSPEPYGYRSRLDLSFRRVRGAGRSSADWSSGGRPPIRSAPCGWHGGGWPLGHPAPRGWRGGTQLGFMAEGTRRHIAIESCAIARPEISSFLPALKQLASERLPENYRSANLVVKTGEGGEIRWGGIGRRSLRLPESDYLWTEIEGKKIFYSLDTFFQAHLGILPRLIEKVRLLLDPNPETVLLDLYSGVGLFWVVLAREVRSVWAVEESGSAMRIAEFNRRHHGLSQVFLREGKTEDCLGEILTSLGDQPKAAIVDPPRKGLSPLALEKLTQAKSLKSLVYVSCHPNALVRDLEGFLKAGWRIDRVVPLDLFPRTKHLEVVTRLRPEV